MCTQPANGPSRDVHDGLIRLVGDKTKKGEKKYLICMPMQQASPPGDKVWKNDAKVALTYCVCFYIIFIVWFIQSASDGKSTSNAFGLFGVLMCILMTGLYLLVKGILRARNRQGNRLSDSLILYLVSELTFIIMGWGELVGFFGITYRLHLYSANTDADIIQWRALTAFIFSTSSVIAAILVYLLRVVAKKRIPE